MIGGFQVGPFQTNYQQVAPVVPVTDEARPGGTSKRDKKLKRRHRYHWEDFSPVSPGVIEAVPESPLPKAIEETAAKIEAAARDGLAAALRKKRRRRLMAFAIITALSNDDE